MDKEIQVDKARKIIHVDMDAFYTSVEQLDRPELRGLAIAVGGESSRGVVSAASYEARNFGVKSAMSGIVAKKLCPNLIFVKPRFDRYKEISNKIQSIFLLLSIFMFNFFTKILKNHISNRCLKV